MAVSKRGKAGSMECSAASIVSLVRKHPKGLSSEQIRKALGIEKREWLRPLGWRCPLTA
jgi:hypothetical protein